jgi:hypothetical protein
MNDEGEEGVPNCTSGRRQPGDLDLSECLDRYRDQRLVLIIAPIGEAERPTYTCGVCGFVMDEAGECPRCKLAIEEGAVELESGGDTPDILDQVDELLRGIDNDGPFGDVR